MSFDDDRDVLERAWVLVTLPMVNTSYTAAVLDLLDDGNGGFCPRALQMFELAIEIAAMNGGTVAHLVAAWTRSQFFAPPASRRHNERGVQMSESVFDLCQ